MREVGINRAVNSQLNLALLCSRLFGMLTKPRQSDHKINQDIEKVVQV